MQISWSTFCPENHQAPASNYQHSNCRQDQESKQGSELGTCNIVDDRNVDMLIQSIGRHYQVYRT